MKKEKAAKRSQVQKGEVKELKMKSEVKEFEKKPKKSKAEKAQEVAEEEVPLKATSKPKKKMKTTKASRLQSEELESREGSLTCCFTLWLSMITPWSRYISMSFCGFAFDFCSWSAASQAWTSNKEGLKSPWIRKELADPSFCWPYPWRQRNLRHLEEPQKSLRCAVKDFVHMAHWWFVYFFFPNSRSLMCFAAWHCSMSNNIFHHFFAVHRRNAFQG